MKWRRFWLTSSVIQLGAGCIEPFFGKRFIKKLRQKTKMINPKILKPKVMDELRSGFRDNNPKGVQVQGFMDAESYREFLAAVANAGFKKSEIRDMHSYFEANVAALKFFNSKGFLSFASAVTGKKFRKATCSLRMFMYGSYTLLHDYLEKGRVEFFFDMTSKWNNSSGGATVLLTDEGEKLMLPPAPNTLVIGESGKSYVKRVNHLADNDGRLIVYGILD